MSFLWDTLGLNLVQYKQWICVVAGVLQVFGQGRRPCSTLIRSRVVSAFEVPAPLDGDQLPT